MASPPARRRRAAGVSRAATTYPASMAAAGDSITRAYDVAWWGALRDNPAYSWPTGTNTTANSEYSRLVKLSPAISGHAYNDAATGAKMSALDGRLKTAASQHVAYVTVLMGANDICTSSIATMTPASTVQGQFRQAMTDLKRLDPAVKVFVSSIPDIYRLWSTLHANSAAAWAWRTYEHMPGHARHVQHRNPAPAGPGPGVGRQPGDRRGMRGVRSVPLGYLRHL